MSDNNEKPPPDSSVPIHIIHYVDHRMDNFTAELRAHTADEMKRFAEILNCIKELKESSDARSEQLIAQLQRHMNRTEQVESAFPTTDNGTLDFDGHHHYHRDKSQFQKLIRRLKENTLAKVIEYASIAALVWLVMTIWQAFVKSTQGG